MDKGKPYHQMTTSMTRCSWLAAVRWHDTGQGLGSGAACSLQREGPRKCLTEQNRAVLPWPWASVRVSGHPLVKLAERRLWGMEKLENIKWRSVKQQCSRWQIWYVPSALRCDEVFFKGSWVLGSQQKMENEVPGRSGPFWETLINCYRKTKGTDSAENLEKW